MKSNRQAYLDSFCCWHFVYSAEFALVKLEFQFYSIVFTRNEFAQSVFWQASFQRLDGESRNLLNSENRQKNLPGK